MHTHRIYLSIIHNIFSRRNENSHFQPSSDSTLQPRRLGSKPVPAVIPHAPRKCAAAVRGCGFSLFNDRAQTHRSHLHESNHITVRSRSEGWWGLVMCEVQMRVTARQRPPVSPSSLSQWRRMRGSVCAAMILMRGLKSALRSQTRKTEIMRPRLSLSSEAMRLMLMLTCLASRVSLRWHNVPVGCYVGGPQLLMTDMSWLHFWPYDPGHPMVLMGLSFKTLRLDLAHHGDNQSLY